MPDILRYRGNITATIDFEHMIGPDWAKRYLAVRSVSHDPATNLTTAKLRGVLPAEFRERIPALVAGQQERDRIRQFYGGQ